jgi:hypothetical protein
VQRWPASDWSTPMRPRPTQRWLAPRGDLSGLRRAVADSVDDDTVSLGVRWDDPVL